MLEGLTGKRDSWHIFIFKNKDKMQVHALYLLNAKAVSSEEVECGTRKPLLSFCSSRHFKMWLEKSRKKHTQTGFREVFIRLEIQALFGSDCHCMHELKEKG